ncbi:PIG-L deacetylase family protein [Rathayibacter sp. CAU 1779]
MSRDSGVQTRGRRIRIGVGLAAAMTLAAPCALLAASWITVNDLTARKLRTLAGPGDRMLVVTAHPDDEIVMAGTLAIAAASGASVALHCFTHGGASRSARWHGRTGADQIGAARLAEIRSDELHRSASALGLGSVSIGTWIDGTLASHLDELVRELEDVIREWRPTLVVSLDDALGLYGHPDHVASAAAARSAVLGARAAGHGVRLFQATLPARQVSLARRFSPVFRRASAAAGATPPAPTTCVPIARAARRKLAAIDAHATQSAVMRDVQPLLGTIPRPVYFRVFSREYFARVL